ncbi:hypothetical protein D3C76_672280 [compost metagenome]
MITFASGLFYDHFRERIILLKTSGWKTEPAFAKALGLEGDPYEALLELEKLPRSALHALCHSVQAREEDDL